ncbi:pyrophosphatase [Devosia geojensis]|uniref:pyrophosphatase n=1 Tax=Devosia geojensis TaxID=443610 RepID=UPI000B1FEE35
MSRTLAELTEGVARVSDRYARVFSIERDGDWYLLKLQEELGELTAEVLRASGRGRKGDATDAAIAEKLADETADLLGSLLLFARHHGVDLEAALARKWLARLEEDAVRQQVR